VSDLVQSGIVQAATQGSFITLTYGDEVPAALRTRVVKVASVAEISTDPTILPAGRNLTITVQDADLNTDPTREETSTATIAQMSNPPHDTRELILREISADSNIFTGLLATAVDPANALAGESSAVPLFAPPGSFLTVSTTDTNPTPSTTRSQVVPVSTRGVIHMQCPAHVAGTWRPDCSQYDITVTDADLNDREDEVETNTGLVAVYNRRGEEEEELTMVEQGTDSNVFMASIAVMSSGAEDCGGGGSGGNGACPTGFHVTFSTSYHCRMQAAGCCLR